MNRLYLHSTSRQQKVKRDLKKKREENLQHQQKIKTNFWYYSALSWNFIRLRIQLIDFILSNRMFEFRLKFAKFFFESALHALYYRNQSHYIEVAQGVIFMEQNMSFRLILCQMAILIKNGPIMSNFWGCFHE